MYKLMIVESPNKIKKLQGFLGAGWKVSASVGHVSDLAVKKGVDGLGIEDFNNFKAIWEVSKEKREVVSKLKVLAKGASKVYLAMDPDREGEAIANQLILFLKLKKTDYERVSFNEITKKAVELSISKPVGLDEGLVEAQEVRRVVDRIYGFKGSSAIRAINPDLKSIGRVQSAGLKIVVDRQKEIDSFVVTKYQLPTLEIEGTKFNLVMKREDIIAKDWSSVVFDKQAVVNELDEESKNTSPPKPLSTNDALILGSKLGLSVSDTTKILQRLFESGHITYIRTDSNNLSEDFKKEAKAFIEKEYKFKTDITRKYKLAEGAQEGHEAIRPVHIEDNGNDIGANDIELYQAIRKRTIQSLLEDSISSVATLELVVSDYQFQNKVSSITNKGWKEYGYEESFAEDIFATVPEAKKTYSINVKLEDKKTKPLSSYSESTFLSKIKKEGIGRPSTYASILDTITRRKYVVVNKKVLVPSDNGKAIVSFLEEYFKEFVQINFTKGMETNLDKVAEQKSSGVAITREFWESFKLSLEKVQQVLKEKHGECPKCHSALRIVEGKYGEFKSCSNYPKCK